MIKAGVIHRCKVAGRCAVIAALTGCASLLRTPYVDPSLSIPDKWQHAKPLPTPPTGLTNGLKVHWWENFNDPVLVNLVNEALRRNNDLAAAALLVRSAQLKSKLAAINLQLGISVSAASSNTYGLSADPSTTRAQSVSLGVSYEADLWGKLSQQHAAAQWEALATAQDRSSTMLSLIGTTMVSYWQNLFINQRIALARQSLANDEAILKWTRTRYQSGAVSSLDVLEAERVLESQRADITQLVQEQVESRNAMAILFDSPPEAAMNSLDALPDGPYPAIEPGLPVQLLARRPDLQAAELRLRETLANGDATRASLYPSLTLTGSLGSASVDALEILRNPAATLGAALTSPLLHWNEVKLNIQVSRAEYERAVINFRQTYYRSLRDVENALSVREQYEAQANYLDRTLESARRIEEIYEVQYRLGHIPIKYWLDAQEVSRTAQVAILTTRLNRLTNYATLYEALGGDPRSF